MAGLAVHALAAAQLPPSLVTPRPGLEAMGAKILLDGYPFGGYDVLVVYEAPDDTTAASVAMAVAVGGAVKSAKTTGLLSSGSPGTAI